MNLKLLNVAFLLAAFVGYPAARGQSRPEPATLQPTAWPAGVLPRSELPQQGAYNYDFSDVEIDEIEEWLAWVRVDLPVDVSGTLSGWLWARSGSGGWLNLAGYRVEGEFLSPRLNVENWEFNSATLRFGYADGTWYVGELSGVVRAQGNERPIGRAALSAKLPTSAPQVLELSGRLSQVQFEPLLRAFEVEFEVVNETAALQFAANVPLAATTDPTAWKATASVEVQGIRSDAIPQSGLAAGIDLSGGQWTVADGSLTTLGQTVLFQGGGKLEPTLPFSATIRSRGFPLDKILTVAKQPQVASRLSGDLDLVGAVRGGVPRGIESASAALRSKRIDIEGEPLEDVSVEAVLDNRTAGSESLRIQMNSLKVAGASVSGAVAWNSAESLSNLVPDEADLNIVGLDLSRLDRVLQPYDFGGMVDGNLQLATQREHGGATQWSTNGQLVARDLQASRTRIGDGVLRISKELTESQLLVTVDAPQIKASLAAELANDLNVQPENWLVGYTASGNAQAFQIEVPFGRRDTLVPVVASGAFEIEGSPQNWLEHGSAQISRMLVTLDEQLLELHDLLLNIRQDAFRLEQFQIEDARGYMAGSALVRRDNRGQHLLNLRIEDLEVESIVDSFAPPEFRGLTGTLNLQTRLQKTADEQDTMQGWSGSIDGEATDVVYRSTEIGAVTLEGLLEDSMATVDAEGSLLGGSFTANAKFALDAIQSQATVESVELNGWAKRVDLQRVMQLVAGPRLGKRYSGTADVELVSGPGKDPEGWHLHLAVPSFRYERQPLANDLLADVNYSNGTLVVREFSGGFAGGRIETRGELQLGQSPPTGALNFGAERMELSGIVALLFPEYMDQFAGEVSYRGAAKFGSQIVLLGNSRLTDVFVYGLPVQDVRNDLRISLSPLGELIEISSQNMHGIALGGRFDGDARVRGGARYSLDSHVRIGNGKLDQLSRALGFEHIVGTGNFNLTSRLRSADASDLLELYGPIQLDFENGDAQSIPVLSDIGRLVPVLRLASTDIKSGVMHGGFANGQLRINDLFLNSESFWLIAKGNAGLTSGRLDIEALLDTGGGIDEQLAQSATQKLIALALPQVAVLTELNDLVRNRTIYFHIGGTTSHPVIQPRAAQTAANALLQNVRRQLLVVPSSTAVGDN